MGASGTDYYRQGPRVKLYSTKQLEELINSLGLGRPYTCRYNAMDELEVVTGEKVYNVTQLLKQKPDFEQIALDKAVLENYGTFLQTAYFKPKRLDKIVQSDESKPLLTSLEKAEIAAINLYSNDEFCKIINSFLRSDASNSFKKNYAKIMPNAELDQMLKEILMATTIAGHGLAKPVMIDKKNKIATVVRKELVLGDPEYLQKRKEVASKKSIDLDKAFLSTASDQTAYRVYSNILLKLDLSSGGDNEGSGELTHQFGTNIKYISQYQGENEVLFPPGTQMHITGVEKEIINGEQTLVFHGRPLRTIDHIYAASYTKYDRDYHELKVMDKEIEQYQAAVKSRNRGRSFVGSLLTTVRSGKKPQYHYMKVFKLFDEARKHINETMSQHDHLGLTDLLHALQDQSLEKQQNLIDYLGQLKDESTDGELNRISELRKTIDHLENQIFQTKEELQISDKEFLNLRGKLKEMQERYKEIYNQLPPIIKKELAQGVKVFSNLFERIELITYQYTQDKELMDTFEYLHNNHLNKDYEKRKTGPGGRVIIDDETIYRPNHGLAHTVRKTLYIKDVIDYYKQYAKDPEFKTFCEQLTDGNIREIQEALAFTISGRQSEVSFRENKDLYLSYKVASAKNYKDYVMQKALFKIDEQLELHQRTLEFYDGMIEKLDEDKAKSYIAERPGLIKKMDELDVEKKMVEGNVEKFQELVQMMGDPAFTRSVDDSSKKFIYEIMNFAHNLDCMRCTESRRYQVVLDSSNKLVDGSDSQKKCSEKFTGQGGVLYTCHRRSNALPF